MPEISVGISHDRETEEWGTTPSCFSLQPLSLPGVMYLTSPVKFPSIENPVMSVRRPGTPLDNGQTKLNPTNSAGEVRSRSPVLFPNSPSLEVYLQNIKQERGESDDVGVDEVDHNRQWVERKKGTGPVARGISIWY
jgi:hypothetical protein